MSDPRTLVVGDIHGCWTEFQELLAAAGLSDTDEVIAIGDIVDRGPDSLAVLDAFQRGGRLRTIQGNHERKHARSFRGEVAPALSQIITRHQLGESRYAADCAWMEALSLWIELPAALLVHGFYEPGRALPEQKPTVLAGTLGGARHLLKNYDRPWYELYDGDRPIVVGHHDYLRTGEPLVHADRVWCIDTGCCTGSTLTGLVLPEFRIVSVRSRKDYWAEAKARYRHLRPSAPE